MNFAFNKKMSGRKVNYFFLISAEVLTYSRPHIYCPQAAAKGQFR